MSQSRSTTSRRCGFTVIELLVVIGIIVLALGLAVPAFKSLSGSNGESSAVNQISAILGRARSEAIGFQSLRGVFFYPDAATGRYIATIVHSPSADKEIDTFTTTGGYTVGKYVTNAGNYYVCITDTGNPAAGTPAATPTNSATDLYWRRTHDDSVIDAVLPDEDSVTLAANVGLQVVCDSRITPGTPPTKTSDAYLRCGAIFFDGNGSLVMNHQISICSGGAIGRRMGLDAVGMAHGTLLYYPDANSKCYTVLNATTGLPVSSYESSCGFVLFDRDALAGQSFFKENDFWVLDPRYNPTFNLPEYQIGQATVDQTTEFGTTTGTPAVSEEDWLDKNGTVFLVNRYNGSLIKGQ